MTQNGEQTEALIADPRRSAVPAIRGYVYQIARTAFAWTLLEPGEVLYLEQAEDFDRLGRVAEAVQVKDYGRPITLRSRPVQETIANCWLTRRSNPDRGVLYRLLTTAEATMEEGNPFHIPGILFWDRTGGALPNESTLRGTKAITEFLLANLDLPQDMVEFLRRASAQEIHSAVIKPLKFDCGLESTPELEARIEERLALVGTNAGIFLSNTGNALNATLRAVWTTVTKGSDRVLTREILLDVLEETNRAVVQRGSGIESAKLNELVSLVSATLGSVITPALAQPTAPGLVGSRLLQDLPPLPNIYHPRTQLLNVAHRILDERGVVAICGPRYSGKSTAAVDIARSLGGRWAWIDIAAGNGAAIGQETLAALKANRERYTGIVIDGIPRTDIHVAGRVASVVEYCAGQGTSVVLAPDGDFGALVLQRLGIDRTLEVVHTEPFSLAEVQDFLRQLNCPAESTQAWATIIELTTAGNPLFIAARLSRLQRDGFPRPSVDDLVTVPAEIEQLRRDVRLIAANELEAPQLEMLNRLSIGFDAYRRQVALQIGGVDPAVANPGNALDALVGVWVQELDSHRYRIFPIAFNFGFETYGNQWVDNMHVAAATAILNEPVITTDEVSDALQHACIAKCDPIAHTILLKLSVADDDIFSAFARSAAWLAIAYIGAAQRSDFLSRNARGLLRFVQIRMSILSGGGLSEVVMAAFDDDYPRDSEDRFVRMTRMLGLTEIFFRGKMTGLSFSQITDYLQEWAVLIAEFVPTSALEVLSEAINNRFPAETTPASAPLQSVGFLAMTTIKSATDLDDLVTEVARHGSTFATTFFWSVNSDAEIAYGLIFGILASYMMDDQSDWRAGVVGFRDASSRLFGLGLTVLADETAAAAVRLAAERDEDPSTALGVQGELSAMFQSEPMPGLKRAKSRALMLAQRYGEATDIWATILPAVVSDGTDFNLFGDYRDAAISYARLDNWQAASEMLVAGAARLSETALPLWKAAMEFDAGYALWRARRYREAVTPLSRGSRILASMQIDQSNDAHFMVLKRIGHTVSYMSDPRRQRSAGFEPPPVACASWLDTTRPRSTVPATEVDMVLATASKYAFLHGSLVDSGQFESRGLASPNILARAETLFVAIFRAASVGATAGFVTLLGTLDRLVAEVAISRGRHPSDEDRSPAALLVAGAFLLGTTNRITEDTVLQWRSEAEMNGILNLVADVLSQIEGIFVTGSIDVEQTFKTTPDWLLQTLASIKIAAALGNYPELWFQVHLVWVRFAGAIPFSELSGAMISSLILERWEALSRHPIRLSRPAVTVPQLQSALGLDAQVWDKLAVVMNAAADAAGTTIPSFIRETLQQKAENGS